jgi:hypothetical protein
VTTYKRRPRRLTGRSPAFAKRYAAARLMPRSSAALGTGISNGRPMNKSARLISRGSVLMPRVLLPKDLGKGRRSLVLWLG